MGILGGGVHLLVLKSSYHNRDFFEKGNRETKRKRRDWSFKVCLRNVEMERPMIPRFIIIIRYVACHCACDAKGDGRLHILVVSGPGILQ